MFQYKAMKDVRFKPKVLSRGYYFWAEITRWCKGSNVEKSMSKEKGSVTEKSMSGENKNCKGLKVIINL